GNVMIDRNGHVRITDFGLASLAHDPSRQQRIAGTPAYMAPEQLQGQLSAKSDLYALGVLLRDLFGGDPPKELMPMIQRCLAADPRHRPGSAREILALLPADEATAFDEEQFASEWRTPWRLTTAVIIGLGIVVGFKPWVSIERFALLPPA